VRQSSSFCGYSSDSLPFVLFIALSFNELRCFNELKAQYVAFQQSGDREKAQSLGNGNENALQSLGKDPVSG